MATLTLPSHTYRSKRPIRRTGCLAAQRGVQIPGLPAGVHLRDRTEQLIGVDRAIHKAGDLLTAEVSAGDLDELQHMIEHGPCPDAIAAAAVGLSDEDIACTEALLDAVCRRDDRILVCRLAAAAMEDDGPVTHGARLVFEHALAHWRIDQATLLPAIRKGRAG